LTVTGGNKMKEKLLKILERICDDEIVRMDDELDLIENGLMDSLATAELLMEIEEEWGVVLSPSEYDKSDFSTVRKIMDILEKNGVVE